MLLKLNNFREKVRMNLNKHYQKLKISTLDYFSANCHNF
jgi:hypothetical protein